MSHFFKICGFSKSNESFSGKGHNRNICKVCSKQSKVEILKIECEEEIFGFLNQSNISKNNIKRLRELLLFEDEKIKELASIVLEVALIKPHKKRRLKYLAEKNKVLLGKLNRTGLSSAHHY